MEDWVKAGKIAAEAREYSKTIVKPGAKLLDVAEKIEAKIRELGGDIGFPVNLSMNEVAAHYTPTADDDTILDSQLLKVDIGTCYNGAIGDTAYTVDLSGQYTDLVKASREALDNAIKLLAPGTTLGEIGKTIQETIQSYGYQPVKNLSGHGLGIYSVHEAPSIPNINTGDKTELEEGMTIAIEPFATTGAGLINESNYPMIYSQINKRPVRSPFGRNIMKEILSYKELPFASRWLVKKFGDGRTRLGLRELEQAENIKGYPPLPEVNKGMVTQAEHSFVIGEKVVTTTRI